MATVYNYEKQCWVIDDVIQRCGHQGDTCHCYGRLYEGQRIDEVDEIDLIIEESGE